MRHKIYCLYPADPCCCREQREKEAREHKSWCTYPADPCDCGLTDRQKEFKKTYP